VLINNFYFFPALFVLITSLFIFIDGVTHMSIVTSVYIKFDLLIRLNEAAVCLNISANKIIALLLLKVRNDKCSRPQLFKPVCYQRGDKYTKWHCLHIALNHDVYETAIDLRKVLKMSVSLVIANAVMQYLNEIIKDFCKNSKNTDNNHHSYIFISNVYDGIFSFTIFWGIPPKKILINLINP